MRGFGEADPDRRYNRTFRMHVFINVVVRGNKQL